MGRITEELLRKRAEHNEGILSTMEEVSLHQQDLEKIENLEKYCRHLKILYLQNNIIEKLENLEKLKELEYLNVAVNSISFIENLEQCESLNKLDLTMNFIDIENLSESVHNLSLVESIRELYLTGNPCEKFQYCKEYIIAMIPQLIIYNGSEIFKSERIKACQLLPTIEEELIKSAEENIITKQNDPDKDNPNKYTIEYRRKLYKELEADRIEKEKARQRKGNDEENEWEEVKKKPPSVYKDNGEIRICNQGKYEILLDEDIYKTGITTFELKLPKFLDTSKIELDLNPQYVRVNVNGKITQWRFDNEIIVEQASIERSSTTGHLVIKAPIVGIQPKPKEKEIEEPKKNITATAQKKPLKPLKEDIDFTLKGNVIQTVDPVPDPKEVEEKVNQIAKDLDIDLSEIPDLD